MTIIPRRHSAPPTIPIPDTRFSYVFHAALQKETNRRRLKEPDALVYAKVIFRDVMIVPFLQSILWTWVLMSYRPVLRGLAAKVKRVTSTLYEVILGRDLIPKSRIGDI